MKMLKSMTLLRLISSPTTFYFLLLYCTLFFENSFCGDRSRMEFGEPWSSPSNFPRNYVQLRGSPSSDLSINEIPRLPVWNGANYGEGQRQIDFTQLFELMGEPRGSRGRELSELITRPKPKCNRRIRILNGVTRIRERGSLARFQCSHGFTLIGPTTVVCLRDRWSEDPPICVKSGCRPLRKPDNGEMRQSIGGAVSAFYCIPTAKLLGNPVIYCDGNVWNGTEPVCHVELATTTTTVATTNVPDEDATEDPELEWDTNLQMTQSTTEKSFHSNGTISEEKPGIDGESTSERIISSHHSIFIPVSTETAIQRIDDPPTTIKVLQSEHTTAKEAINFNFSDTAAPPHHEATTIGVIKGQSETPFLLLSEFLSSTSPRSFVPDVATSPPESPSSESQLPIISDALPIIVPVTPEAERLHTAATSLELSPARQTTVPNSISPLPTTTRRFKIWTKRPRPLRPTYTRKPGKRPIRKRLTTTTTTLKPRITRYPQRTRVSFRPRRPVIFKASTPAILPSLFLVPGGSDQSTLPGDSNDYAIAIDKEFLPREQIEIKPDMLNINISKLGGGSRAEQSHQSAHSSVIGGVIFFVIGLSTFSTGVILYCWRKNKGIARARPYDVDGRTLSLHDANDDFTWLDQNQRETNSAL